MVSTEILSANRTEVSGAVQQLQTLLTNVYGASDWAIVGEVVDWTMENKNSLWENELQAEQRSFLERAGGKTGYHLWLGSVHYATVTVTSKKLFDSAPVRDNSGWRLMYLALPAPSVFVVGLAHHYQQTPSQRKLGLASNFLFDLLAEQLEETRSGHDLAQFGRKIETADWDGSGLTLSDQQISGTTWPGRLPLRFARNTTTKKILSTFITVRGIAKNTSDENLRAEGANWKTLMELMAA